MSWFAFSAETLAERMWMIALGTLPLVLAFALARRLLRVRPATACAGCVALLASMLVPFLLPETRSLYRFEQLRESGAVEVVAPAGWPRYVLRCPLPPWLLLLPSLALGASRLARALRARRHASAIAPDAPLRTDEVREHLTRLGVRRPPRIAVTAGDGSPHVRGLLRGTLVIPADTWRRLGAAERDAVLLHELAHLRRGDLWTTALARTVQLLFPWNPAVWWLGRVLAVERELACDERVIREGIEPEQYAHALLALARTEPAAHGVAVGSRHFRTLRTRVQWLFVAATRPPARVAPALAASILLLLGWTSTRGANGIRESRVTFPSVEAFDAWLASDESAGQRRDAVDALGNLGRNGRFAVELLERTAESGPSRSVRREARDALLRIERD